MWGWFLLVLCSVQAPEELVVVKFVGKVQTQQRSG
jgi:hypothetical protein